MTPTIEEMIGDNHVDEWLTGDMVVLGNDEQGFFGDAREDRSGRIRSRAKIEATASDGAENASDHFVTSFFVLWGIEKVELLFEAPPCTQIELIQNTCVPNIDHVLVCIIYYQFVEFLIPMPIAIATTQHINHVGIKGYITERMIKYVV